MSAYVVMIRERVTDETEMKIYSQSAARAREGHAITPLARYGSLRVLEGPPADGLAVFSFPSMQDALNWYGSPAYQEALRHRQLGADYRVLLVEGV